MIASICSPERATCSAHSRCSLGEAHVEQQLGHADHAVHRRADLVADVGEERRLHVRGLDRAIVRERRLRRDPVALGHVDVERDRAGASVEVDVVAGDLDVDHGAVLAAVARRVAAVGERLAEAPRVAGAPSSVVARSSLIVIACSSSRE